NTSQWRRVSLMERERSRPRVALRSWRRLKACRPEAARDDSGCAELSFRRWRDELLLAPALELPEENRSMRLDRSGRWRARNTGGTGLPRGSRKMLQKKRQRVRGLSFDDHIVHDLRAPRVSINAKSAR